MRKQIIKLILKIYVSIRIVTGPLIFNLFYKKKKYPSVWKDVKDLNMVDFDKKINSYEYKWEKLKGLLDASFDPKTPDYFFSTLSANLDCDDYARIWRMYANYHQMPAWEIIITDIRHPFKKAHVVTIAKGEGLYWLFNYHMYGPFKTFDTAIEAMYDFSYAKKYSVWVNYPFEKERY